MNKRKEEEVEFELKLHRRPKIAQTIEIPTDMLESLKKVADSRDMSVDALLKVYIGYGLRQDLTRLFADG